MLFEVNEACLEYDTVSPGNDVIENPFLTVTLEGCIDFCYRNVECKYFTYYTNQTRNEFSRMECYLKSKRRNVVSKVPGAISGSLECGPDGSGETIQ